jgi:hypothetical protein
MNSNHRRLSGTASMAFCALLAPPLISLLTSPLASADPTTDVTGTGEMVTLGPYPFDGYTDTFAFNDSTYAFDNYLTGTYDGSAFDLDTFLGPSGSGSFEVLLTDPGIFQLGIDDVNGSISYIDNFFGIDFIGTDPGLGDLGAVTADIAGALGL